MKKITALTWILMLMHFFSGAQDTILAGSALCNGTPVNGVWMVPNGVTVITVELYSGGGGGGGGGGGTNGGFYNTRGGGGGGGGGYTTMTFNVIPNTQFSYSVGSGGCGGNGGGDGTDGRDGIAGGNSTFSGTGANGLQVSLSANGGAKGTGGDGMEGPPGSGGAGGSASGGTTNATGATGNNGILDNGGAGGSAAGPDGGVGGPGYGAPGIPYGGAGAGGEDSDGGHGAPGAILITYGTGITSSISGLITTETGTPVPGVTVTLTGDDLQTTVSDGSGHYGFSVAQGGSYTVTPTKANDVVTNNGITSIDVLLIRRHILGTPLSTPYKIIAADVEASNTVSTLDILLIRSMILQSISTFPNGRLWTFVPSDHVFADLQNPFPYATSKTYNNLQQSMPDQDFIGIKLGDVNDSWDPGIP